jgi:hypothetical protein
LFDLARSLVSKFDLNRKSKKTLIHSDTTDLRARNPSNPDPDGYDQSQTWKAPEIHLEDGRILVLEST